MGNPITTRARGFAPGAPRAEALALLDEVKAVLAEYREHPPLSVRQIFYRLVGSAGYDKTEAAHKRLGEVLKRARRGMRTSARAAGAAP